MSRHLVLQGRYRSYIVAAINAIRGKDDAMPQNQERIQELADESAQMWVRLETELALVHADTGGITQAIEGLVDARIELALARRGL